MARYNVTFMVRRSGSSNDQKITKNNIEASNASEAIEKAKQQIGSERNNAYGFEATRV